MTDQERILLHGKNATERIVGLHVDEAMTELEGHAMMRYYIRHKDDSVTSDTKKLTPFFFLSDMSFLSAFPEDLYNFYELEGDEYYKFIVFFTDWYVMWKAVAKVKERAFDMGLTETPKSYPNNIYMFKTAEEQFLAQHGMTMFKGMEFDETHRLRWDIETYSHRDGFPNPEEWENKIIIMTLSDNRGYSEVLYLDDCGISPADLRKHLPEGSDTVCTSFENEAQLLQYFVELIRDMDPDVIVGHNVFAFDFMYTLTRCRLTGVPFAVGRNGEEPDTYETSKRFAERDVAFLNVKIPGRHIIDTYFETMAYDVFARDLPGYGLKVVAQYFGFAAEDREYVEGDKISWHWDNDPLPLLKYAVDDTVECANIDNHLGGATFYLTQMLPMTYQRAGLSGTSTKIESLMVREYLRVLASMPTREKGKQEVGGYTDLFMTGVFPHIVYADVESLYPSIMLQYEIQPEGEWLELFPKLLRMLTKLRLDTKAKRNECKKGTEEYNKWDSMQSSYKVLINSFYGALGFYGFIFNDFSEADRVTVTGQDLLKTMVRIIREDGGDVVEVDTDGVLCMAPEYVFTKDDENDQRRAYDYCLEEVHLYHEEAGLDLEYDADLYFHNDGFNAPIDDETYVKSLTERMPEGIVIGFDGRAIRMISYKKKNYALQEYGKKEIKVKGGSLNSRLYEQFGRRFNRETLAFLMAQDVRAIAKNYRQYYEMITNRTWTVDDFMKKSTLKEAIESYVMKTKRGAGNGGRNKDAAYELALQRFKDSGMRPEPGDRIRHFIAGNEKKSNVKAFRDARFAETWEPWPEAGYENPDAVNWEVHENTNWYRDKRLKGFADKFKKFFTPEDFKLVFGTSPIDEIDFDQIKIVNKKVEREKVAVIFLGPDNIDDMFWVRRAVAGAKFLKTLDNQDNGMEIGTIITSERTGLDKLVKQWANEQGYALLTVDHDEGMGAQGIRVQATSMIKLAEGLDMKPAVIIVDDENAKDRRLQIAVVDASLMILNDKGKPIVPVHYSNTV